MPPKILCIGSFCKATTGGIGTAIVATRLAAKLCLSTYGIQSAPFIVSNPDEVSAGVVHHAMNGPFRGGNGITDLHALFLVNPQDQFCKFINISEVQAKAHFLAGLLYAEPTMNEDIIKTREFLKTLAGES
jgi:hypothetical protein